MSRGSVRKRGSSWSIVYDVPRDPVSGKRRQKWQSGFRTKADATRALNDVIARQQAGTFVVPSDMTFGTFLVEEWLPGRRAHLKPTTWLSYENVVRIHLVPRLGSVRLQALAPGDLNGLYAALLAPRSEGGAGLKAKTVRNVHAIARKALNDAARLGYVARNVADLADRPTVRSGSYEHRTWTPSEARRFLAYVDGDRYAAALRLGLLTGLRRGEVLGLRWKDIDLERGRLAVRQTLVDVGYEVQVSVPKTNRSRRSVAIDAETIAVLKRHRARQAEERLKAGEVYDDQDYVFAHEDGSFVHPSLFSEHYRRLVEGSGLPYIRLHDLRHTHATHALQAGVAPKVVSDRLGHSTVAFTMDVYAHAVPAMEEAAADTVADLIANAE